MNQLFSADTTLNKPPNFQFVLPWPRNIHANYVAQTHANFQAFFITKRLDPLPINT